MPTAQSPKTTQIQSASITMKMEQMPSRGACSGCTHVSCHEVEASRNMTELRANIKLSGGGMPQTTNRTKWPVHGGAISIQPGWFPGHSSAYFYINIGINEPGHQAPKNMSHPVHPVMAIVGPSNNEYPGQFCLPQIGMPANLNLQVGDNITIQVIETAQHGAALYSVSSPSRSRCAHYKEGTQTTDTRMLPVCRRNSRRAFRS